MNYSPEQTEKKRWNWKVIGLVAVGLLVLAGLANALGYGPDDEEEPEATEETPEPTEEDEEETTEEPASADDDGGEPVEEDGWEPGGYRVTYDEATGEALAEFQLLDDTFAQYDVWDSAEDAYQRYPEASSYRVVGRAEMLNSDSGEYEDDVAVIDVTCDAASMAGYGVEDQIEVSDYCDGYVHPQFERTS